MRKLIPFFLATTLAAQVFFSRDPRWRTVGVGALASRPATCTANRDVYICNGSGCGFNGQVHYCTSTDTWTAVPVGGGVADPGSNGILARTALNTTVARTITGTANEISVADGDGVSANPTLSLAAAAWLSSKSLSIDAPATADAGKYHLSWARAVTINRVHCSTDTGTVSINLDVRAIATPNTPGADVLSAVLVCDSNTQSACASGCDVNTITAGAAAAHLPVNLQITAVASSPNVVRIHIEAQ